VNEDIMRSAGFGKEVDTVKVGGCGICFKPINQKDFRDGLSRKEYGISGMCQACQDDIFGKGSN